MLSFSIGAKKGSGGGVERRKGAFGDEEDKSSDDEKDYVTSVDGREIRGTKKREKKEELVIPLIGRNEWRGENDDLERQAIQEILGAGTSRREEEDETSVPILLRNRVPEGFETDEALNVALRPDQPTLDDYSRIPIEEFGMAMLRGMGWRKGEGIGLTNKKVVEVVEPILRPRGLGLGAERPQVGQTIDPTPKGKDDNENLTLKKGACVLISQGVNRGKYGKVEAFDEDNNRVIIQLSIGAQMVGISKYKMTLVSESEFAKKSKILNNELYEEYKKKNDEADAQRKKVNAAATSLDQSRISEQENGDRKSRTTNTGNKPSDPERAHDQSTSSREPKGSWVVPNLRVRFIDSKYRNGKYYKKKFIVEDVMERNRFVLKSDEGDVLDKVKSSQIETVIPKSLSTAVYILNGREKGKIGSLIVRDMQNELGVVKIPDEGVVELHFDDICEIVGDYDDFL